MYRLTLTQAERKTFDLVGDRYFSGNVATLIRGLLTEDQEWSQEGPITFFVPESIAWEIMDLARQDDFLWPCFSMELKGKLNDFCDSIV